MRRDADREPFHLRRARPVDAPRLAEIEWRASKEAYAGRVSETVLARHTEAACARRWAEILPHGSLPVFVAERPGDAGPIGFAWVQAAAEEPVGEIAELGGLFVLPQYQRRGVARALLDRVLAACRERGFVSLRLWTLETNREARAFYEACDFTPTGVRRALDDPAGATLRDVEYAREV